MTLEKNVGKIDSYIRLAAGGILVLLGLFATTTGAKVVLTVLGLIALFTGWKGTCFAYRLLGINTNKGA
ncbi:MAG: DUF2892 domain-containing protein [Sphingobacteriia bacterium]|nr:DUF2892 domain-containing protein [Sphingobacteriia bacterium]NCC39891.1 DUF2892 domain-containing protein [Gammaproteobacteria bacterium]